MTKNNSLLDRSRTSLNQEQIDSCFNQFKEAMKEFKVLPQVELVDKIKTEKSISLKFRPISKSVVLNSPSLRLELVESCQDMESVKSIVANAYNCGMCRGTSKVVFTNKNMTKFEVVLERMKDLFNQFYAESIKIDKEQVEFEKLHNEAKDLLKPNRRKLDGDRTDHGYLGDIRGSLYADEYERKFSVTLKSLSIEQVKEISKVIPNL